MKKVNFQKAMWLIGSLLLLVGITFAFNAIATVTAGVLQASVIAAAAQTGTGPVTTDVIAAASSNLLLDDIESAIIKMQPDANPLDTIMRELKNNQPAGAWETRYYAVGTRGVEDTITTSETNGGAGAADTPKYFIVSNIDLWNVDDVLLINGKRSGVSGEPGELAAYVTSIDRDNSKITCLALNSGTSAGSTTGKMPQVANGTKITNIGCSKHELDAKTDGVSIFPTDEYNYIQIHMAMVEASMYMKLLNKEVKWELNDMAAINLYNYRQKCELTSLFGTRKKLTYSSKQRYFSAGITRYITNKTEIPSGGMDNAWFNTLAKNVFSGNDGSPTRVYFASPNHMEDLMNVPDVQKQLAARESEVVMGVKFKRIETAFGDLLLKMHKGFSYVPTWAERGLILDVNYLAKRVLKPLETRNLDLISSGVSNSETVLLSEAFCVATHYPDVHMAIVPNGADL